MKNTVVLSIIAFVIALNFGQVDASPEIDDEVMLGFEHGNAKAIPDWVRTTMGFYLEGQISEREILDAFNYLFENNVMHLSQEASQEVHELRAKVSEQEAAISSLRTLVSNQAMSDEPGERIMQPEYGAGDGTQTKTILKNLKIMDGKIEDYNTKLNLSTGKDFPLSDEDKISLFEIAITINARVVQLIESLSNENPELFDGDSLSRIKVKLPWLSDSPAYDETKNEVMFSAHSFAGSQKIAEGLIKEILVEESVTEDDWKHVIDQLAQDVEPSTVDGVVDELQGVVVLCNIEIDKQIQQMDAELKIIEQWLEIISEKQEGTVIYDDAGRITSDTIPSTSQYNESDLEFITRILDRIDMQVISSQTGLKVLEENLENTGEDASLANIDLQNSLQKTQQSLQAVSNMQKAKHDAAMSFIRNMK